MPAIVAADDRVLFEETFDDASPSPFAEALLADPRTQRIPDGGTDGSDAVRIAYVGYERGSRRVTLRHPLAAATDHAVLTFNVFFEDDFQWQRGGKLHGVGPAKPVTGGRSRKPDAWSARLMFKPRGRAQLYLYDQHPEKKYGVGPQTDEPVFKTGRWHRVSLEVRLNDPPKADGLARLAIDGKTVLETKNVRFRADDGPTTLIRTLMISTFHGGHDASWAPKSAAGQFATVHARFDDFRVVRGGDVDRPP